jgi:RNA polymerase sigma-70 factor, ECF subfamily
MTDWPAIVRDYGPLVWGTVYRLVGNETDAADAFQQTFLAAAEFAAKEPVRDWPSVLRRFATARALDVLRSRVRRRSRFGPLQEAAVDAKADDPISRAAAGELAEALRHALAAIDADQAAAFCLTALDDLSYLEAADALGVTPNHVGVLVHRARAELRSRLRAFAPAHERGEVP